MLIIRKENMQGVNILSLEDGTVLSSIDQMHTKAILDFCILDDMNTLISAGRDKKIKVWIVKNQKNIHTLLDHQQPVNSIVASNDQQYLISGGDD